jgi:hypothetical protein
MCIWMIISAAQPLLLRTLKALAYLLRLSSLHQRFHRYHSEISHIPGVVNQMADDCSRLWHLADSQIAYSSQFPLPAAALLAHASLECHDELSSDLGLVGKVIEAGVVSRRAATAANSALGT